MRPDYERMQRQHQSINAYVGHTAHLRAYVSASAGKPQYGAGDEPSFQPVIITGLFAPVTQDEINAPGGVFIAGDVMATLYRQPHAQDEIIWQGTTYRVASDPLPMSLMGNNAWKVHLRRGGRTG